MTPDELETIRRRAVEVAKFAGDRMALTLAAEDVPALIAEIEQLRRERDFAAISSYELGLAEARSTDPEWYIRQQGDVEDPKTRERGSRVPQMGLQEGEGRSERRG